MIRIGSRWCYLGMLVCLVCASPAHAQISLTAAAAAQRPALRPVSQTSTVAQIDLHGIVSDESGEPLAGAVVSALGATTAFAVSDDEGRFVFRALPPGPYLVRAHLRGYVLSRGRVMQVSEGSRNVSSLTMTKRSASDDPPAVLAAGIGAPEAIDAPPPSDEDGHGHGEVAWRLRHLKRSVLKEAENNVADLDDDNHLFEDPALALGRAVGRPARFVSALFSDLSLNGQLNLLTTTSFDRPQDLFSSVRLPRGVAYISLTAPGPDGEWRMRGTVTQGDLSSWIVAGSYVRDAPASHAYEAGFSYAMQRYLGGNAEALAAMRDGSRNVGAMYAYDTWTLTPHLQVNYGAKFARYDYLGDDDLLSPRASVTIQPVAGGSFKVRALVSHREIAPGAEEFMPPAVGLWLPPERTFSAVTRDGFRPERLDHFEVAAEREWAGDIRLGVRVFRQRTEDQGVTLFGVGVVDSNSTGHYHVGSAGDFEARGWGMSVSRAVADGIRASVDYTHVAADWRGRTADLEVLKRIAGSVVRDDERVHDLTASVESVLSPTSTRVFVLYKVNTAFAGSSADATTPVGGARFDIQVNQALPFLKFASAQWEALVAVRNLFREDLIDGSVYDELLVARPPTRVLCGVTVRF